MEKRQFLVLYRQFLFRLVDVELLSTHARGDAERLLGQLASLLIFFGMLLSIPALGAGGAANPLVRLIVAWGFEHFLIATTMLVTGLFAVLSWDATFPNTRDAMTLLPLPVRLRTLFLAKVAAVATALAVMVTALHSLAGLVWPLALNSGAEALRVPALGWHKAAPPFDLAAVESDLHAEFAAHPLSSGVGVAVGLYQHGQRRILTFGEAKPDSMFQIGSITKTFTALVLARMAERGEVSLSEPVRQLIPEAGLEKPAGSEITLADLATHRSGLSGMPANLDRNGKPNPGAAYGPTDLYAALVRLGTGRRAYEPFGYSNFGYGLLGHALATRAGTAYAALIAREVTMPLGMPDTVVRPSPGQQRRILEGRDARLRPLPPWQLDALAGAGALLSTAPDMLRYVEANLAPPEELAAAIAATHRLRAEVQGNTRIGLGWVHDGDTGVYWHNGAISGYTSYAFFHPQGGYAAVVLANQGMSLAALGDLVGLHILQRFSGQAAASLEMVTVPRQGGLPGLLRRYAVYWSVMFAAGGFMLLCVLGMQGLAAQLLPRRLFLRASSVLQLSLFALVTGGYFLQPMMASPAALQMAQGNGPLAFSPSYWFLGLFQQLNGSPALGTLASRAWTGLAAAGAAALLAYVLSYLRTVRRILEEPEIVPVRRSGWGLPWPQIPATVEFTVRTLVRSRRHRLILAFYLGLAFAISVVLLKAPGVQQAIEDGPALNPWREASAPLMAATIATMILATVGARAVFALPMDLGANWIFRLIGLRRTGGLFGPAWWSLIMLSVAPVWFASAALCFVLWPWREAGAHLAILALLGLIVAELCLAGFHKIPFACAYLPGKSQVHLVTLGAGGLMWLVSISARFERDAIANPPALATILAVLVVALIGAAFIRRATTAGEIRYEESAPGEVIELGLSTASR